MYDFSEKTEHFMSLENTKKTYRAVALGGMALFSTLSGALEYTNHEHAGAISGLGISIFAFGELIAIGCNREQAELISKEIDAFQEIQLGP